MSVVRMLEMVVRSRLTCAHSTLADLRQAAEGRSPWRRCR